MAVGFTPKHTETVSLGTLTQAQFWALARQAALSLGWQIDYASAAGFIAQTSRSAFKTNAEVKLLFAGGNALLESVSTGSEMMDLGRNKKTVQRLLDTMQQLAAGTFPHDLQQDYDRQSLLFPPAEKDLLLQPPPTRTEAAKDALGLFIPREGYFVTPVLVLLNMALFIAMVATGVNLIDPDGESLVRWGANYTFLTLGGEPWRLLTCCFLHIGVMHLLLNMYALVFIGLLLEPHLGKARFAAVYLLTGIGASAASLWWHEVTLSAGASGAIFGLYGVFLALLTTNVIDKAARGPLLSSIGIFVAFNLFSGFKGGGTDNAAHIGGLLSGIIAGYVLVPGVKAPLAGGLKWGSIGALTVLVLGISFALYQRVPAGLSLYNEKTEAFGKGEETALAYYSLPQNTPPAGRIAELEKVGIPAWERSIKALSDLTAAGLPPTLSAKVEGMVEYCQLRKRTYELMVKELEGGRGLYEAKISELNKQINAKLEALSGQ